MKLSIVIPAHNEEGHIASTIASLHGCLVSEAIPHEIVVVNDHSTDGTEAILQRVQVEIPQLRYINNPKSAGFGLAVRCGLEAYTGDAVALYMADASDRPADLVHFYRVLEREKVDCVFGSRFVPEAKVIDYPKFKLLLNRFANAVIRLLFGLRYNDVTNAFKLYRRNVIDGAMPLISNHFNLTVELPLKAIVRGYRFRVVPNYWINRKEGISKLRIQEMGSRYLFIVLYCLIEKWLSRGDYHEANSESPSVASDSRNPSSRGPDGVVSLFRNP
jgi:dolichol-phosphate mannosyltransferase